MALDTLTPSLSPLLMNLPQIFESALLYNPLALCFGVTYKHVTARYVTISNQIFEINVQETGKDIGRAGNRSDLMFATCILWSASACVCCFVVFFSSYLAGAPDHLSCETFPDA